jgi:hypothetical protein
LAAHIGSTLTFYRLPRLHHRRYINMDLTREQRKEQRRKAA